MKYIVLAYLDPTAGSLGYQLAISGVLASLAAARMYWRRLKDLLPVLRRRGEKTGDCRSSL